MTSRVNGNAPPVMLRRGTEAVQVIECFQECVAGPVPGYHFLNMRLKLACHTAAADVFEQEGQWSLVNVATVLGAQPIENVVEASLEGEFITLKLEVRTQSVASMIAAVGDGHV